MRPVRLLVGASAILLIGVGTDPVTATAAGASADVAAVACKAMDDAGGTNELVFELRDDRIHAFRYRRSVGLPQCEIEASRSPSSHAFERAEWIDESEASEVFVYTDGTEDAHVRIVRHGSRIELHVIEYDRWWFCGYGQYLNSMIVLRRGEDACIVKP